MTICLTTSGYRPYPGFSKSRLAVLGVILALALSACGGGDPSAPPVQIVSDGSAPPSPSPSPTPGGDTTKPTVSITSPKTGGTVSGTAAILTASASDNVAVAGVQFKVNGSNTGAEDTSSPYSVSYDTTQTANGSYTLTAVARDAAGNTTTSAAITVTVSNTGTPPPVTDSSAPSVPAGLTASATASFQINLAWSAATDNVGVTGYKVYRNGTEIGTTTSRSYAATGLAAQTAYTFTVAAFDAANNTSAPSTAVSATTLAATVGTSLADLAARLKAGEWGELVTSNINSALGETSGNTATGDILPYAEGMVWDPVNRSVYFVGSDHNYKPGSYNSTRFVYYSDATNSWGTLPSPAGTQINHAYDHNTLNPVTGDFYFTNYSDSGQALVKRFNVRQGGSWSDVQPQAPGPSLQAALTFVPELNTPVFFSTGAAYQYTGSSWSSLGSVSGLDYHLFAEYNPVHKVTVFGGGNGSSRMYKLSATGQVTSLKDAPLTLSLPSMEFSVDPVSGEYLVINSSKSFRAYNVVTDSWRTLSAPPASIWNTQGQDVMHIAAVPVSTYGVIMYVTCDGPDCRVNVYKHAVP